MALEKSLRSGGMGDSGARHGVAFGDAITNFFEWIGNLGIFFAKLARTAVKPPFETRELVHQIDVIGPKSLLLVALAGGATGIVMSLQMRDALIRFGAKGMLPAVIV